jgi:glutamate-1-semialdehyde 2,1-aminomutase
MFYKSEILYNRSKKVIPSGVNSSTRYFFPYPFFVDSGKGSKITTVEGNQLIDYCMGYGANLLGHTFTEVNESVKEQIDKGNIFCIPTELEMKLAEKVSTIIPSAPMLRLVNSGMEATLHAIRLCRAFTKRKKILKFDGCYHGSHDYVLVNSNSGIGIPATGGSINEIAAQTLVVPFNDIMTFERTIETNSDIACVIIEPVCANMGIIPPENGYLNEVRKITQEKNILLVFDEVITGFRLSLGGASQYYKVSPDLLTFAKSMANGFPISAIAGKEEIMEQFTPKGNVYEASTFAGNPISVSASLATINILQEKQNIIYLQMEMVCNEIVKGITDAISDLRVKAVINCVGSMFQIFFNNCKVKDAQTAKLSDTKMFAYFFKELLSRGIFIPPSQFESCFLSFSHTLDDIKNTIEGFYDAFKITNKSFL